MTGWTDTSRALSNITDEGLFESLATDVLRLAGNDRRLSVAEMGSSGSAPDPRKAS